jgi:predicted Zn-dependent peptidase
MFHDNPKKHVFEEIHECLYEKPFGSSLIGTYETMNSINREKITEKFKEVYQPNNMILCVVGDSNFEDIIKFAENNFKDKKGNVSKLKIVLKNKSKVEKRKGINQANLIFAYHVPLADDQKNFAAQVLSTLMVGGMSSRLFTEIREKRNLAYSVNGGSDINNDFAYSFIYVGTTKEKVEIVKKIILKEFESVSKSFGEKELNQVKEQLIGNYQIEMEDSQTQMVHLIHHEVNGNAKDFFDFEKKISEVKLEDVKKLAKIKDYSFFALIPE